MNRAFYRLMTIEGGLPPYFCRAKAMNQFGIIAFTHRNAPLEEVGRLHLDPEQCASVFTAIRQSCNIQEIMYLSTCNRVEFLIVSDQWSDPDFCSRFIRAFRPDWSPEACAEVCNRALIFRGEEAVNHFFRVASSLDSLVVGEREIITQVRNAYDESAGSGQTGDFIRLLIKSTIETAKRVFTDTPVARNPVSVVSLAYRKLRQLQVSTQARILVVGAGQTNTNMCKYLKKHGFKHFAVFNRSLGNAEKLAQMLHAPAYSLDQLDTYTGGFDILIACTASAGALIDVPRYQHLLQGDTDRKVIIDLAIPPDVAAEVYHQFDAEAILVESLKQVAEENLALRRSALDQCEAILMEQMVEFRNLHRQRQVELAMKEIPKAIRDIREHATTNVFARELESLDANSREVVERMLLYLEKKYISVPMKMAREILLDKLEA